MTHALPDSLPTGTSKEREALQLCEEKDQRPGKRETDGNRRSMHGSNASLLQVHKDKEKNSCKENNIGTYIRKRSKDEEEVDVYEKGCGSKKYIVIANEVNGRY